MKRALVTGAAGFIGANLTRRLLDRGDEVHAIVRPETSLWRLDRISADLHLHRSDLRDEREILDLVERVRPDWVFHLAAHGGYDHQSDVGRIVQDNTALTIRLVDACLKTGFESFVNTGSSSEYGFKDHAPPESDALEPNSVYAVTKAAATLYCAFKGRQSGARLATLRLYSVYGPWEEPRRFVPSLVAAGLDRTLPPLTSPDTARDFVFIDDVVDAYVLAAASEGTEPGAIFNVGTGTQTTLRQMVALIRRLLPIDQEPSWNSMADRQWDTRVWVADSRRIRESIGWSAQVQVAEGLARTIDWMRGNRDMMTSYK